MDRQNCGKAWSEPSSFEAGFPRAARSSSLRFVDSDVRGFSYQVAVACAVVVPYLEIVSGVCLVLGVLKSGSRLMAFGMLVVFVLLLAQAAIRGLDADCSVLENGRGRSLAMLGRSLGAP